MNGRHTLRLALLASTWSLSASAALAEPPASAEAPSEASVAAPDAAARQRRDRGRGAGQHGNVDALGPAGTHQPEAGVGHERHARVGNEGDARPGAQLFEDARQALFLVVVVKAHEPLGGHAAPGEQLPGAPGVLGQHQRGLCHHFPGAGRKVT
nr:hypothetical protein [Pseudoxanthomonas mexicana]